MGVFDSGITLYPFGNGRVVGLFAADLKNSFALNSKGFMCVNPKACSEYPGRNELKTFSFILKHLHHENN